MNRMRHTYVYPSAEVRLQQKQIPMIYQMQEDEKLSLLTAAPITRSLQNCNCQDDEICQLGLAKRCNVAYSVCEITDALYHRQ